MYDLIIIGAGPAGLTAGLYAGRYKLNTLILEKLSPGGQIIFSPTIENFPGFPVGIATDELIERFKKQVEDLGVEIRTDEVMDISPAHKAESLIYNIASKEASYQARSVIIASGAKPKPLGLVGEDKFIGRGVSYCGTCDGPLYKNKEIMVVGGGDRAIEEAIFLASYAKAVTLIHRRDELRASRILQDKARQNPKINFILNSVIEELIGKDKGLEGVKIKNLKTSAVNIAFCQGLFIFVGTNPNTAFIGRLLKRDESGFIITDEDMQASGKGIFACGDCRKKSLYQVVTACSDGAVAAASAHRYLL